MNEKDDLNPDFTPFDSWGMPEWRHARKWVRSHEDDTLFWLNTLTQERATLLSLLLVWWCEDGWARPQAAYAIATRDALVADGLLGAEDSSRLTDRGRDLLKTRLASPSSDVAVTTDAPVSDREHLDGGSNA